MLDLVKSVEFNKKTNPFQEKLKKDVAIINADSKLFIAADKTSNYYKISVEDHAKLLGNNITKDYKKTNTKLIDQTNIEDANITNELDIADRVFQTTQRQSFITIKDHKPNY